MYIYHNGSLAGSRVTLKSARSSIGVISGIAKRAKFYYRKWFNLVNYRTPRIVVAVACSLRSSFLRLVARSGRLNDARSPIPIFFSFFLFRFPQLKSYTLKIDYDANLLDRRGDRRITLAIVLSCLARGRDTLAGTSPARSLSVNYSRSS